MARPWSRDRASRMGRKTSRMKVVLEPTAALLDIGAQIAPALVGHHQVAGLVGQEEVQDPHDVRVLQGRQGLDLVEEQLAPPVEALRELPLQGNHPPLGVAAGDLLGHVLLDHYLLARVLHLGLIDQAEPALAEDAEQSIGAEQGTGREAFAGGGHDLGSVAVLGPGGRTGAMIAPTSRAQPEPVLPPAIRHHHAILLPQTRPDNP